MTDQTGAARSFKGASVLITGGGSGVGFAVAEAFLKAGAAVTIIGRNGSKLQTALTSLNSLEVEEAGRAYSIIGDVGIPGFAHDAAATAQENGKKLDILINAAGMILRKTAIQTTDDEWHSIMRTNVDGVFYMSCAAARLMPEEGAIVNISSTCGLVGCAGLAAYNTSKGAVIQLTRSMALELASRKITVNAVAPGAIDSDMLFSEHPDETTDKAVRDHNLAAIPIGSIATPHEVARAILFLAREKHITGTILSVDGGYTAQ